MGKLDNLLKRFPDLFKSGDEQNKSRVIIFRQLFFLFMPIAIFVFILRVILVPDTTSTSLVMIGLGAGAILVVAASYYYLSKTLAFMMMITLGYIIVILNAFKPTDYHVEIAYILVLPILTASLASFRLTLFITVLNVIVVTVQSALLPTYETSDFFEMLTIIVVLQVFIIFASYQRDKIEKQRLASELKSKEGELLKQILMYVSHDLRTPLSVINTSTYLLKKTMNTEPQLKRLERIENQSKLLDQRIEDMLILTRLNTTEQDQETLVAVSINDSLQNIVDSKREELDARNLDIALDLASNVPDIHAQPDALSTAFQKIIENAITYTEQGGNVCIRTYQTDKSIHIEVEDSGIGIAPEHLSQIFDFFYRVDEARSSERGGLGLGLTIAKRTIELYGGTITAESELGVGTTIKIIFPFRKVLQQPRTNIPLKLGG